MLPGRQCASPMDDKALKFLYLEPTPDNPEAGIEKHSVARTIVGLGGWICSKTRPDGYFAFVALSRALGGHFSLFAWHAVLRWGWYLVHTKEYRLTYRALAAGEHLCAWVDSSSGNAGPGESFGGIVTGWRGSGAIGWTSVVPKNLTDSSWGAELVLASSCMKGLLGLRIQFRELALALLGGEHPPPTSVFMDANAVLLGNDSEKVSRDTKYLAAKYAMIRDAEKARAIALKKVNTEENTADGMSKPLVGLACRKSRALMLGHVAADGTLLQPDGSPLV